MSTPSPSPLQQYLADSLRCVQCEIECILPCDTPQTGQLYARMRDYPARGGKGLRPALALATTGALTGACDAAFRTAATLELFHNAFLIHDDVEDGSEVRRHRPTLHQLYGVPVAVNVGDGMLAMALQPLLDNVETVGLGATLNILELVVRMARESAEGQALELEWIRTNQWALSDKDYTRMVYKKTAWYSFLTPVLVGATIGRAGESQQRRLGRFAGTLGIAFQIVDDLLNLQQGEAAIGKEHCGDLWEGKRTLMLLHALRVASAADRERAVAILRKPRPEKTADEVGWLYTLIDRSDSIPYARRIAVHYQRRARLALSLSGLEPSVHRAFLCDLLDYVLKRTR